MARLMPFTTSLWLASAALLAAAPQAWAHQGHGDAFHQQGDVRQVRANAASDSLLGVVTARPEPGPDGLSVPSSALVDADGKPLLFVRTRATYDPVLVETATEDGDRVVIRSGIDPTDDVVVQGALSLYAESKKAPPPEPAGKAAAPGAAAAPAPPAAPADAPTPAPAEALRNPGLIAAAAAAIAAAGWLVSRRLSRRS